MPAVVQCAVVVTKAQLLIAAQGKNSLDKRQERAVAERTVRHGQASRIAPAWQLRCPW